MAKRSNGEASYRFREDRKTWEGRITINYKSYSVYGKKRSDCVAKIEDLKARLSSGVIEVSDKTTFKNWLETWLDDVVAVRNAPSTYDNYKTVANTHIIPELGHIRVNKLTTSDIQRLIRVVMDKGKSPSTINLVHHICRVALNDAITSKLIMNNPALHVVKPKLEKKEITPLSVKQVNRLTDKAEAIRAKERMFACFVLIAFTGLRRGEVLGLKWSDVNFRACTISVQRAIQRSTLKGINETDGKTKTARRLIHIPPTALAELKRYKIMQDKEKETLGKKYNDEGWIFCHEDGNPYYPTSLRKMLLRILKLAGVPTVRLHDLRHTFATLMLLAGENPKVVQEAMGHADIKTTLGTYSHVNQGIKKQAAIKLDHFLYLSKTKKPAKK